MAHQIWQSHIPGWVIRQIDEGQVFFFFPNCHYCQQKVGYENLQQENILILQVQA